MSGVKYTLMILLVALVQACSTVSLFGEVADTTLSNVPDKTVLKHLHYLSSDALNGRRIGTTGGKLAQDYIARQLKFNEIEPLGHSYFSAVEIESVYKKSQGNNVIGLIKGKEFPNRFIVLSAHFDHIGSKGRKVYNGADDNASGTAALLYYAKLLKQSPLRYSVILLFIDGEEANLHGANAFIEQNPMLLSNIILNINIDMIAGSARTKKLRYISRGLEGILNKDKILALQEQDYPIKLVKGFRHSMRREEQNVRWEVASDHGAFYRQKIPFIYFGVGIHKNYHQPTDTYENINQPFFLSAVAVIYHQINFIAQNL